jgi:hypothetical protein
LRYLKSLSFFGKHNLAFGFNRPERSEIWKASSAFLKVPALHARAPSMPPTEPPFAIVQGIVLVFFVVVIIGMIRRYRPMRSGMAREPQRP